jgi:hypothetical protein
LPLTPLRGATVADGLRVGAVQLPLLHGDFLTRLTGGGSDCGFLRSRSSESELLELLVSVGHSSALFSLDALMGERCLPLPPADDGAEVDEEVGGGAELFFGLGGVASSLEVVRRCFLTGITVLLRRDSSPLALLLRGSRIDLGSSESSSSESESFFLLPLLLDFLRGCLRRCDDDESLLFLTRASEMSSESDNRGCSGVGGTGSEIGKSSSSLSSFFELIRFGD